MSSSSSPAIVSLLVGALALASCGPGGQAAPTEPEAPAMCAQPAANRTNPPVSPGQSLFALIDEPQLTADQKDLLAFIRAEPTAAEVRFAVLVDSALSRLEKDSTLVFPVAPGLRFAAVGQYVRRQAPDSAYWQGPAIGEDGQINVRLSGDEVVGSVQAFLPPGPPLMYSFKPLGGGLHAVVCIDPSKWGLD